MKLRTLTLFLPLSAAVAAIFSSCAGMGGTRTGPINYIADMGPVYPGIASYVVMDAYDQHAVLAYRANQRRPVASLTKIATAVVALDILNSGGIDAGEMMTVPPQVTLLGGPGPATLQPGDRLSVRDGLYAAMVGSDNYAAETVAFHLGQTLMASGIGSNPMAAFVAQMNALCSKVGLGNTRFANAPGLDLRGRSGYSTAADMAKLTAHALEVPGFSFYCSQPNRRIAIDRAGTRLGVGIRNTNELLGRGSIDGVKTGTTQAAGECLIITSPRPSTVVKRPDGSTVVTQHRLIVVVLGTTERFGRAWQLLNDGWAGYFQWRAQSVSSLTVPAPLDARRPQPQPLPPAPAIPSTPAFPPYPSPPTTVAPPGYYR